MNRSHIWQASAILLLLFGYRPVSAQFYPDSLANWCIYQNVSPDGEYYVMHMPEDPDTLIDGTI